MHFSTAVFTALALVLPALAAPRSALQVEKYNGETTGKYIVKLKPGISTAAFLNATNTTANHEWNVINGFSGMSNPLDISIMYCKGEIDANKLDELLANGDVESISEDGIVHALGVTTKHEITHSLGNTTVDHSMHDLATVWQTNAPWGLSRLSNVNKHGNTDANALNFWYAYDSTAGAGVDIYVISVYIAHTQFNGRARWGTTFGGYPSTDVIGYGTHCAGTVAGSTVGVAKAASIIVVKVLGDDENGTGTLADVISGVNWVYNTTQTSGRPSIVAMFLEGSASDALDSAIASLTGAGVSAGNYNGDAIYLSPARAPSAITVGATNIADARSSFSNYGAVVDIFAPGENVISAWNTGPNATAHVAGLVATLISSQGNLSPAAMATKVKGMDLKGKLSNIRKHARSSSGYLSPD
ncbi:hypothetical protein DXG01_015267 [Tephrocybe rancida]|nr:hypothetical protein DXG01_015267 [Tephrocybe rancida]